MVASSGFSHQSCNSSEMPLSVIVLWLSWLMWNPFSLFEYILSGLERPKLKSFLASFWQEVSDSKWLHSLFTDKTSICLWTAYCLLLLLHFLYSSSQWLYSYCVFIIIQIILTLILYVFSYGSSFFQIRVNSVNIVSFFLIQTLINSAVCVREILLLVPIWHYHSCYLYNDRHQ